MASFHVSPSTGDAGKCSATQGRCPFGGDADHYASEAAARAAFEKSQSTFEKPAQAAPKTATKAPATPDFSTPEGRLASLPAVRGVTYELMNSDVANDGMAYSSFSVLRTRRNGMFPANLAQITLYEDGDALVWDGTADEASDESARGRLADALKKTHRLGPLSSTRYLIA